MSIMRLAPISLALLLLAPLAARAQMGPGGPPSVGVAQVTQRPMVESSEYIGRVQATDRVELPARVTAFLEDRLFTEGSDVTKGQLLFRLERGPFEADLAVKQAAAAQTTALMKNAALTLGRAQTLRRTEAGTVSAVDAAEAQNASLKAQLQANLAQVRASQINLDYTEIHAPISGTIGRSAYAVGNVVSPASGPLAVIVSQDPMYVVFPMAVRAALELRSHYAGKGGFGAVRIRLRLPDGRIYGQDGQLEYLDPSVTGSTDTLVLRARIPNPRAPGAGADAQGARELLDGEFVTVIVEGAQPVMALSVPRSAVLQDQQGAYVYVVGDTKIATQRRVQLGQTSGDTVTVLSGLKDGETIIVDGLQRVRPGVAVNPAPIAVPQSPPAPARG